MKIYSVLLVACLLPAATYAAEERPIHPKAFELVTCWLSDTEQPAVTQFSLDAIQTNRNEYDYDKVTNRNGWVHYPENRGFYKYKRYDKPNGTVVIEFLANGGGTFTRYSEIAGVIEERTLERNGEDVSIGVFTVKSIRTKSDRTDKVTE